MRWSIAVAVMCSAVAGTAVAADTQGAGTAAQTHPKTPAPLPVGVSHYTGALLGGLDKTTARVTQFEAPFGQMVRFGTLRITVKDCRKHPPELTPESAAFLEIDELYQDQQEPKHLFIGWMFASSPALSALQHPVYDVWVLDCTMANASSVKSGGN